jgi:two-component system cell cycle response regulator
MDGFAVCRQIRQLITKYTPLVMLTEKRTSIEDKLDGLSMGADDYLPKPLDPRKLLARISALLRIKQTLDEMGDRLQQESQAYEIMKRMALTDHLTGLYNRNYMVEIIEREFSLATRYHTSFSCLMIDIDFFKDFNTKYGHPIGDWVLQNVAGLFTRTLRQPDVIARYGGDEFLGMLPMTDAQQAMQVARRLRSLVAAQKWDSPAGSLQITISLGIASIPLQDILQPEQLIACADKALYQAKENGRNQVCVFQPDQKIEVAEGR